MIHEFLCLGAVSQGDAECTSFCGACKSVANPDMTYRNNYEDYLAEQNAQYNSRPVIETGVFHHKCNRPECTSLVIFDDEPYCFTHSDDSGSSVRGYSARSAARFEAQHGDMFDSHYECKWCGYFRCECM